MALDRKCSRLDRSALEQATTRGNWTHDVHRSPERSCKHVWRFQPTLSRRYLAMGWKRLEQAKSANVALRSKHGCRCPRSGAKQRGHLRGHSERVSREYVVMGRYGL